VSSTPDLMKYSFGGLLDSQSCLSLSANLLGFSPFFDQHNFVLVTCSSCLGLAIDWHRYIFPSLSFLCSRSNQDPNL